MPRSPMPDPSPTFTTLEPIRAVADVRAAVDYYYRVLGFTVAGRCTVPSGGNVIPLVTAPP